MCAFMLTLIAFVLWNYLVSYMQVYGDAFCIKELKLNLLIKHLQIDSLIESYENVS